MVNKKGVTFPRLPRLLLALATCTAQHRVVGGMDRDIVFDEISWDIA